MLSHHICGGGQNASIPVVTGALYPGQGISNGALVSGVAPLLAHIGDDTLHALPWGLSRSLRRLPSWLGPRCSCRWGWSLDWFLRRCWLAWFGRRWFPALRSLLGDLSGGAKAIARSFSGGLLALPGWFLSGLWRPRCSPSRSLLARTSLGSTLTPGCYWRCWDHGVLLQKRVMISSLKPPSWCPLTGQ